MSNYFKDNDDLQFYLEKGIDWEPLVRITERDFKDEGGFADTAEAMEFYREIHEMLGDFVSEEIAPHVAYMDEAGVEMVDGEVVFNDKLQEIFDKLGELDLHGISVPRELGGMNAPMLTYFINSELIARADVSVMTHHGFHGGLAMAALVFSVHEGTTKVDPETLQITETRFRQMVDEIVAGEAWGCMDITEPDAGSDMAMLRCKGEQDDEGNWFVTGEKIFITSGHGKWHFVIARTEEEEGEPTLAGLSMFLVPTYHDEEGGRRRVVALSRVEEKMGGHASATCGLVFERAAAQLVGERGEGFRYMLHLMNNARVGVGFECLGIMEASWRKSREYAAERGSMGKSIDRHEMIADYLDEMKTDIQSTRALAMYSAFNEEMAQKLEMLVNMGAPLSEAEKKRQLREARRHKARARLATPLLKYHASEKAVHHARRCVQIHGGNGYITEYGAEKLLRDAMIMPIYEGTSQIQALMAMKDALGGIIKDPQRFVRRLAQSRWRAVSAKDELEKGVARLEVLSHSAQQHLVFRTVGDKMKGLRDAPMGDWADSLKDWDARRDFAYAMLHAEDLTRLLTFALIAEILWTQAEEFEERRELLERFLDRSELEAKHLHEKVTSGGRRLLDKLARLDEDAAPLSDAAE